MKARPLNIVDIMRAESYLVISQRIVPFGGPKKLLIQQRKKYSLLFEKKQKI